MLLREIAANAPRDLSEEQLAQLRADPEAAPWTVIALIARGRLEEGQKLAFEALERAEGSQQRSDWLATVAAMYEYGAAPLARATMRELDRRIPADVSRSDDPGRVTTSLLRELGDVSGEIDKELVRTLGAFVRSSARGHAMLAALPTGSDALAKSKAVLHARAPALTRLAFPELAGDAPAPLGSRIANAVVRRVIIATIAALFAAVGGRQACALFSLEPPAPPRMAPLPVAASPSSTAEGRRLCASLGERSPICTRVHTAEDAIDRLDCTVALTEADAVVAAVFGDPTLSAATTADARALRARASDRCVGIGPE